MLPKADLLRGDVLEASVRLHGVILEGELVGCKSVTKWARSLIPLEDTVDPSGPLTVPPVGREKEGLGKAWKMFYLPKGENFPPVA